MVIVIVVITAGDAEVVGVSMIAMITPVLLHE